MEVAGNLHSLAVEQLEKLEQNSSNSSKPPSSDSFYQQQVEQKDPEQPPSSETQNSTTSLENSPAEKPVKDSKHKGFGKKPPGKQLGAKGMWRTMPLVPQQTIAHHPETCAACNAPLEIEPDSKPHMGYYVLELTKHDSGIEVTCQLHHYYGSSCECGHHTKLMPGIGYISVVEGRSKDLRLQEYGLVGPMLATFIAYERGTLPDVSTQNTRTTA